MKITTLIENRPSKTDARLAAEWGLSLHVACDGLSILFDTGATGAFAGNAEHLGVNLQAVDAAVLSHHHYDHAGGLRRFLELNYAAPVYLGRHPDGDCYGRLFGCLKKHVGLDPALMRDHPGRFAAVEKPEEILPNVFLLPQILRGRPRPAGNKYLYVKKDTAFSSDQFTHEIIMAIRENGGLVVFTGCSHSGVLNMVDTAAAAFPDTPIKAVIGGFHFVALPLLSFLPAARREVQDVAEALLGYPVQTTYTGHCTGDRAFNVLQAAMGDRIRDLRTGACFDV